VHFTFFLHLSIKNSGTEFHKNRTTGTVADTRSERHGHTGGGWAEGLTEAVATGKLYSTLRKERLKTTSKNNKHYYSTRLFRCLSTFHRNSKRKPSKVACIYWSLWKPKTSSHMSVPCWNVTKATFVQSRVTSKALLLDSFEVAFTLVWGSMLACRGAGSGLFWSRLVYFS